MCFNMSLVTDRLALEGEFGAVFEQFPSYSGGSTPSIEYHNRSGFSHPLWPVITAQDPGKFSSAHWGLVPSWVKDRESALRLQDMTINARGESIWEKPSFRSAAAHARRCLIPVDGFFEPHEHEGKSYPFYIHRAGKLFALAGIYDRWVGPQTGREYLSFSIITADAAGIIATIHNKKHRMPLILTAQQYPRWLDADLSQERVRQMLGDDRLPELFAHPVSKQLYSRTPAALEPSVQKPCPTGIDAVDRIALR
jgi:putative SOS response-associated peptidase YedK